MRRPRFPLGRISVLILFIGSQLFLSGCDDGSKTSGTMVQRSEEDVAHLKSKLDTYKAGRAKDQDKAPRAKR
jgi:hypothetical protein